MSRISGVYYVIPRERASREVIGVGAQTRHVAGTCIYACLKAGTPPQCFLDLSLVFFLQIYSVLLCTRQVAIPTRVADMPYDRLVD
jgi:hypothetical protein